MNNNNNLAQLTSRIAAKRRARSAQIPAVVFDDDARRDFLTGFAKRKRARKETARQRAKLREKEERQELRREQRRHLREKALENAAAVEKAYGAISADTDRDEEEEEWPSIRPSEDNAQYEDEETLATVTVVEHFDPDTLIHGAPKPAVDPNQYPPPEPQPQKEKTVRPKVRPPKIRYETKDARRREQTKQRRRRTEKAELAGGKAARKPAGKRRGGGKR